MQKCSFSHFLAWEFGCILTTCTLRVRLFAAECWCFVLTLRLLTHQSAAQVHQGLPREDWTRRKALALLRGLHGEAAQRRGSPGNCPPLEAAVLHLVAEC